MKKISLIVSSVILLGSLAPAMAAEVGAIAADKSSLTFVYKQMNVPMNGQFKKFQSQLNFDPAKPEAAKATIDIDLSGMDAGSPEANEEIGGKLWFNTKAFPQAKFVSNSFKALGGNKFTVTGKMTIKGKTQDVSAPLTFTPQGKGGQFDGTFTIKRADFAIGEGAWADFGTVANDVVIKFKFVALPSAK